MKPNFALNVTDDQLGLLHRTRAGWMAVGETRFDRDDLDEALGFLRTTATELAPKGVTTKIVIPNSQILYMDIAAPGPSPTARRAQITQALEGRTPYAVDELVFDWSGTGDVVQVAVLARETLEQAEGFLAPHGFNPISFVAIPPDGAFDGEPFFGPTAAAADILGKGRSVTRDATPIQLAGATAEQAEPDAVPDSAPDPVPAFVPDFAPDAAPDLPPDAPAKDDSAAAAAPQATDAIPPPDPASVAAPVAGADADTAPVMAPPPPAAAEAMPEPFQQAAGFVGSHDASADTPEPVAAAVDEAPFTHVADTGLAEGPPEDPSTADKPADDVPPAPSQAALVAFASRRAVADATPRAGVAENAAPPAGTPMPGLVAERLAARAQALAETSVVRGQPRIEAGGRNGAAFVTSPSIPAPGAPGAKKRKAVAAPVASTMPVTDMPARKPLTKPGGTFASSAPVRGKPRYLGLILTGILLLFLALIAAWSSFFLASRTGDAPVTAVASNQTPAVVDEMLADAQDPADFAPPVEDVAVGAVPAEQTDPAAVTDIVAATPPPAADAEPDPAPETQTASDPAPDTGVDATLPLAAAPDAAQDEIFLSAMDTPPPTLDATALAAPAALADAPPAAQLPPPPFGTVYQFDAAGLIVATAEGIVTPDGVRVVAGRPAQVPPTRPEALAAAVPPVAAVPDLPASAAAPAGATPESTFAADPALANARPRVRPAGLVPANATPGADDAALTADTPTRTTSLIPAARPAAILAAAQVAGEDARLATEAASLAASAAASDASQAAVLALVAPDANRSRTAVAVSRMPAARPRDLGNAVAAAVAAASRAAPAPEPEPAPQQQAAVEPEAEEEPEVVEAAPSRPTGRTVAEQATFVNAIALNRINLIGVYGTQSNRYALVRQPNGRYKKVGVGDRIDGGTVAAITENELRYQKGGRMIALEMPRG